MAEREREEKSSRKVPEARSELLRTDRQLVEQAERREGRGGKGLLSCYFCLGGGGGGGGGGRGGLSPILILIKKAPTVSLVV